MPEQKNSFRSFIYISFFLLLLAFPLFRFSNEIKSVILNTSAQEKAENKNQSVLALQAKDLTSELVKRGTPVKTKREVSQNRKIKLKELMRENSHEALKLMLDDRARQQFAPEMKVFIEEEVVLDGSLEILHADEFDKKVAKYIYHFRTDQNKKYTLHLTKPMDNLKYGTKIRIKGTRLDDEIVIDNRQVSNFQILSRVEGITTSKIKKVAYVLVSFQNTPSYPYSPDHAREVAFTTEHSVKNYFHEASFDSWNFEGHTRADGDIFGWHTIPYDNTDCMSKFEEWSSAAEQQVSSSGGNLNNYEKVVFAFNDAQGCPGIGWTHIGNSKAWITGNFSFRAILHELGHTYGLNHATSRVCSDSNNTRVILSSNCSDNEYGDPYDVMGFSSQNHFNNFNKGAIGWYEPSNTHTVIQSGAYLVAPLGPNTSNIQALRIPVNPSAPDGNYYYLEYRQPYRYFDGFANDANVVNGVSIRIGQNYGSTKTHLLDMTPNGNFLDSSLTAGNTFSDAENGVEITLDSISSASANMSVFIQPPQCVHRAPEVVVSPLNASKFAGEEAAYQVSIKNIDSSICADSQFTFNSTVPHGFIHSPMSQSITLSPKATHVLTLRVTSPDNAEPAVYSLLQEVVHSSNANLTTSTSVNYTVLDQAVITPTPTPSPTPTPTPTGDRSPPNVEISYPKNGQVVDRKTVINISASAFDSSGISQVQFFINNTLACTDTLFPYSCSWIVPNQSNIEYFILAKAFDTVGNTAQHGIKVRSSSCLLVCL
jgi:hypothetical protein